MAFTFGFLLGMIAGFFIYLFTDDVVDMSGLIELIKKKLK